MTVLTILSPLSAWLVMLSLGLGADTRDRAAWRHELSLRYWLGVYALPLLLVVACAAGGWVSAAGGLGLALCILSGSGTSGVAWARARGADNHRVTARLASGALLALIGMPIAAAWVTTDALGVALTVFVTLVLAQWLPWQVGRWWKARRPLSAPALRRLEQAASLSVVALILVVAWQSLPQLLVHPRLAAVAAAVALALALASAFDAADRLEAMGVVKNLTLVTLVLTQSGAPEDAMTALAAFGAVMYPAAWLASRGGVALTRAAASGNG
ncbi:MAG: hypothetical protein K0S46_2491 [Moraxellaceae bacterium]|jgi:hypothetical protein|nr:hypothetical protein [Moraxellaceae bacterium]